MVTVVICYDSSACLENRIYNWMCNWNAVLYLGNNQNAAVLGQEVVNLDDMNTGLH